MTSEQLRALRALVSLDSGHWLDNATTYTCLEADTVAAFLAAWYDKETADDFLARHADGDKEGDKHWKGAVCEHGRANAGG